MSPPLQEPDWHDEDTLLSYLEHRQPLERYEQRLLERELDSPRLERGQLDTLRFMIGLAKLTLIRDQEGRDRDVMGQVRPFTLRLQHALGTGQEESGTELQRVDYALRRLLEPARALCRSLLQLGIDEASLNREIGERKRILVLGGGGGAGYGYAGIFQALAREQLDPHLICGTSIGAISAIFRARRAHHDPASIYASVRELSWPRVFDLHRQRSCYGLPAALHLRLRRAIGVYFRGPDGRTLTMQQLAIPTYIVVSGITLDALKHELTYYEHFLDDVLPRGGLSRMGRWARLGNLVQVIRELMENPSALREIVFGEDPHTLEADCVDAAGFSAAIPGILHYDVFRDDPKMKALLGTLYGRYGISRLGEGGMVANVPSRVAFRAAMRGDLDGHRNVHIVSVDCFAPRAYAPLFYPVQQLVRSNVLRDQPYAHYYLPLKKTLNPTNLVPTTRQLRQASLWARQALAEHVPLMSALCRPVPPL